MLSLEESEGQSRLQIPKSAQEIPEANQRQNRSSPDVQGRTQSQRLHNFASTVAGDEQGTVSAPGQHHGRMKIKFGRRFRASRDIGLPANNSSGQVRFHLASPLQVSSFRAKKLCCLIPQILAQRSHREQRIPRTHAVFLQLQRNSRWNSVSAQEMAQMIGNIGLVFLGKHRWQVSFRTTRVDHHLPRTIVKKKWRCKTLFCCFAPWTAFALAPNHGAIVEAIFLRHWANDCIWTFHLARNFNQSERSAANRGSGSVLNEAFAPQ